MHWLRAATALLLVAATVSDAATTILAGCQTGTSDTTYTTPSDGGEYEALGCKFDVYITINSPASLAVTNSTSVLVSGGSATADYGIEVAFPATYSEAQSMGALHYTVRDVAFGANAMLVFSGAMPANSSVVLSNNSFSIIAMSSHAVGSYLGSTPAMAIRIGAFGGSLQLNNSRLLVIGNVAVASVASLNLGMVFIALSTVQLTQGSSVAFDDNIIRDSSSNHDICTVLWSTPTASLAPLVINGSSSFSVSNNRVYASRALSVYVVRVINQEARMAVDILQSSSLTVSSNTLQSSQVDAFASAVIWGSENVSVAEYSIVSFNDNYIFNLTAGTQVGVVIWQNSDVYISNNSRISLANNSVTINTGDTLFAVVFAAVSSISVRMGSLLSFSNNTLRDAVVTAISAAVSLDILTGTGFTFAVSNSSRVQMDGNAVSSETANSAAAVYWHSNGPFILTVDQGSFVSVSLNTASTVTATNGFQSVFYWYCEGASSTVSISVSRYSTFSMNNSSGNRMYSNGDTAAVWWLFSAIDTVSISLDTGSTLAVSDNSILDTICPSGSLRVIYFDFSSSKRFNISVHDRSSLTTNSNMMWNTSALVFLLVVHWNIATLSTSSFAISNQSLMSFSNNVASGVRSGDNMHGVYLNLGNSDRSITVKEGSILAMNCNSFVRSQSVGFVLVVCWSANPANQVLIALANNSTLSMNDNFLRNHTSELGALLVYWTFSNTDATVQFPKLFTLTNNSHIVIQNNSAYASSSKGGFYAVVWAFGTLFTLQFVLDGESSITVSGNTLLSCTAATVTSVVLFSVTNVKTFELTSNHSSLSFSNNSINNTTSQGSLVSVQWLLTAAATRIVLASGSLASFSGNAVINSTSADFTSAAFGAAVSLDISASTGFTFAVSNSSRVQMDGNVMSSVTANSAAVVYWHSNGPFILTVDQGSFVSVSLNTASSVNTNIGFQSVFYWYCEGASSTVSISVSRYSTFSMGNNSGNRLYSSGETAAVWWNFAAIDTVSISLDLGSTKAVSDNSILDTTCPPMNLRVIVFDFSSSKRFSISVHDRSSLTVNSNMMRNSSALSFLLVVQLYISSVTTSTFFISNRSTISFSNNVASGVSCGINMHGVYIDLTNGDRSLTIREGSMLAMDCNSLVRSQSTGVLVVGSTFGPTNQVLIDLADNSTFSMNDNFLRNHTSELGAALVQWWFSNTDATVQFPKLLTLTNNSHIVIQNNSAYASRSKMGDFVAVYWGYGTLFTLQFVLDGESSIAVSGNTLHNCSAITVTSVLLSITNVKNFQFSINRSSLSFSNNSICNTTSRGSLVSVQWNVTAAATTIILANASLASFSGNAVSNSTSADFTSVVQCSFPPLASISVVLGSAWRMARNKYVGGPPGTLASVATIAVLCAGCKLLAADSAIQIEGNTLKSSSTTSNVVSLVELQCTLSLEGESKLSIRDNEYFMVPSSGSKPGLLLGNLSLAGSAAVDMSHTIFTATATGPCPPPMARFESISSSMPQRSSVTISSNALSINTSVPSSLACPCLSIGSLASGLTVHSNTVSSNASNTTLVAVGAMSVPSPGIVKIAENSLRLDAPAGSLLAVSGYLTLEGRSGITVVDNRVTRLSAFAISAPLYYLVTANALNMTSQKALTICGNIVYGDGSSSFKPDRFLMPPSIVNITKRCSVTSSGSHSPSASESPSATVSITSSGSHSPSASESPSTTVSITSSGPDSPSASESRSNTDTQSHSCQNLTDVNVQDTCEVFRLAQWLPLAGSEYPVAASLLFGAGDCTTLKIPYSAWTGRGGTSHHLRIIATDPRVPIHKGIELPNPVTDSTLFASVASETTEDLTLNFNESDVAAARRRGLIPSGDGGNLTVRFQVGLATVTYLGSSTLNQLKYRLDCGSWPRCPIPMPSAFEVTLLASDKIFPVALSETVTVGSVIASIGGGVTVSPSVVAQLGVLSSLRRMSRCYSPDPDDEEANSYDQYTKGSTLNPFGISIGEGGGARRYVRGSLVMSVVYALCLSALMFAFTTASSRLSHHFHAKAGAPPSLLIGYPSALAAVGSFVMDGAASAGIVLGVQGATAGDWVVGWLSVLLCLAFVGQMILATVRWLPPSLVAEPRLPEVAFRARSMRKWLGSATHKWAGTDSDEAAAQWMRRYGGYVADLKVPWYGGLEQGMALALCILAAIPIGEPVFCAARGAVCTLLVAVQATVMVVLRPMVHRWRWLLMLTVLVLQTIMAALSIANAQLQEQLIELAMDAVGAIVFVLLIAAFVLDVLMMLRELNAAAKRWARRDAGAEDAQDFEGHELSEIAEPLIASSVTTESSSIEVVSESAPPAVDLTATDSDIVRQILEQLRDYELAKEHL